ncbi:MAG: S8 family peptidase [Peptostreptococcaceae bacterium]
MSENFKLMPFTLESKTTNLDYTIPYGIDMVNATNAWKKGYTGKGVVIAVIDTGCDKEHPALKENIIGGRNFTTDDNSNINIYNDYQGHGTHVAGTIAGTMTPIGITGVAPNAKLLILKALDKNGSGQMKWVIDAINYAISKNVNIISMSLGGSQNSKELHDAIKKAINKNILVVCAAGNRGDNGNIRTDELDYPGSYEEVIEVGAIDSNKNIAPFSNSNDYVDLVAPGVKILSTYKNKGYATLSGTSMATPHVSGILAILIEWNNKKYKRRLTEQEYYEELIKFTQSLGVSRKLQGNGYLKLNI